jgi:hypothetical protein
LVIPSKTHLKTLGPDQSHHFRCYGLMDNRGRWRAWRFGPAMAEMLCEIEAEAARAGQVLFASVQTFAAPADITGMTRWRQVREQYTGEKALPHLAPLYFDIDCDGDLDKALLWTRALVEFFVTQLGLSKPAVRVWFSGNKGAHIIVDPVALGIEPSATLTADMKAVALELVRQLAARGAGDLNIDRAVYSLPRMLRLPDQVNPKSGLFKIELRHHELFQLTADQMTDLAQQPRGSLWSADDLPKGRVPAAAQWWSKELARAREPREFHIRPAEVAGLKVRPDGYVVDELVTSDMPPCIAGMVRTSASPGTRNRVELQTACWAKGAKVSFDKALSLLAAWTTANRPELSAENARVKAESIVRSVYSNASYGFSCIAARSAARAVGVACSCDACQVVRPRSLRQVYSLRVRHDTQWNSPKRISLEDARGLTTRIIDRRIAACHADRPGKTADRRRQDPRGRSRTGQARDAGRLCGSDA